MDRLMGMQERWKDKDGDTLTDTGKKKQRVWGQMEAIREEKIEGFRCVKEISTPKVKRRRKR